MDAFVWFLDKSFGRQVLLLILILLNIEAVCGEQLNDVDMSLGSPHRFPDFNVMVCAKHSLDY